MEKDTQIVVFASQKGGSGKTTLSGHIAVQAERSGAGPVALIDTDPQGSLAKWWNARSNDAPLFAKTSVFDLTRDIELLRRSGIKLIVIDTPPAVTEQISQVVAYADLVIVPTRPSPHDLRAVGVTVDLVEAQRKPLLFVVNCATGRARITSETAVSLSQHGTVAPITLHNRVDFAASMIDGRTVGEVAPSSRSAKEVDGLWAYIEQRLQRMRPVYERRAMEEDSSFEIELLTPFPRVTVKDPPIEGGEPEKVVDYEAAVLEAPPAPRPASPPNPSEHPRSEWDGIDRRGVDNGPPRGFEDRRRYPVFGRRNAK